MLLGKRQRPPMKRTTSMTEFTLDLTSSATLSSKIHRRNSADHFLTACHLCNRQLIPGRDIFMYRGDSAFCSLECRQQQMNEDEKKDNKQCSSNTHTHVVATTNASDHTVAAM